MQYRRRVWLRYRGWEGAESEREVNPYGLVFHFGRWSLAGFDHRSHEMRVFRVDRVLEIEPRDEAFQRPRDFAAVEYRAQALANVPWGLENEVLRAPPLALRRALHRVTDRANMVYSHLTHDPRAFEGREQHV